jgi:hypothetical protein
MRSQDAKALGIDAAVEGHELLERLASSGDRLLDAPWRRVVLALALGAFGVTVVREASAKLFHTQSGK